MIISLRLLLFSFLITTSYAEEISTAAELQAAYKKCLDEDGDFSKVIQAVDDLPLDETSSLYKKVSSTWPRQRDSWISDFQKLAKTSNPQSGDLKNRIRELRKELENMKKLGDAPMKGVLKKRGLPALDELKKSLIPKVKDVMLSADDATKKKHRNIHAFAKLRDALAKASIIPETKTSVSELKEAEKEAAHQISGLDRKGLKIMEKNRQTAEKKEVPEAERIGIEDANLMRLLLGYTALEIDPKLCDASRDHSKDMATLKFFAHQSPVQGKKNPSDRAKNFGTSGNGENIFVGNPSPQAANKAWFLSPGHHRNMFNPRWKKIGMGRHKRHWTQMFF